MEKKKNDLEHAEVNIEKEINDLKYSKVEREEFQEHNILISKLRMDREKLWAIRERIIDTFIQNGPFKTHPMELLSAGSRKRTGFHIKGMQ